MALISIVAIVARLGFFIVMFVILRFWPPSWVATPSAERDPLLPNRAPNPRAGK